MRPVTNIARHIAAVVTSLLIVQTALADVAPPEMPPGSNPSPDSQTKVQMASERITISVYEITNPSNGSLTGDLSAARVDGTFTMRNRGKAPESMQVRFPLADPSGKGSGFSTYPEVQGFVAGVDGQLVPTTVISLPNPSGEDQPPIRWAAFDVTFPITRNVLISVSYTITPTGYLPEAVFAYVLSTGAGWYGPIGRVDIALRLPYPATYENFVTHPSPNSKTTPGWRFVGGEVRWQWQNLEPTAQNDWFATVLAPTVWRAIVAARQAELAAPRDAQAWLALSKAYIQAVPYKYEPLGAAHFVSLGVRAMQVAVSLDPRSADMRVEYADLLWYLYQWQVVNNPKGRITNIIYYNLNLALKLDPNNARARQLKDTIDQQLGQNNQG